MTQTFFFKPSKARKGDYCTWEPVCTLAGKLDVPCYLMTFGKGDKYGSFQGFGVSKVVAMSEDGLKYLDGVKPWMNQMKTVEEAQRYFAACGQSTL